jgi:hypothetical protein
VRLFVALFALSVCSPAFAALPTGIPAPPFGYAETPPAANYFVDNSNPAATDVNNPRGTPTRPRRSVPTTLPAGAVVEVRGGPYSTGLLTWTAQGTKSSPVFVIGVGSPVFQGNGTGDRLRAAGSYMLIDGFTFVGVKQEIVGAGIALRHSEVRQTYTTAVAISGPGALVYGNYIHDNGNANSLVEYDTHGVMIVPGTNGTWVIDNEIARNGGDAVQIGSDDPTQPIPQYAFVGGNTLHEDRENGVDIKRASNVIVSQNVIYGYVVRSSSAGEAIVVHAGPEQVWIINNAIGSSQQGIVCTGATGYYVVGNLIANIHHAPGATYDPNSLWGASGVLTYNTTNSVHVNNTIWASDAGISIPTGSMTEVVNTVTGGLTAGTAGVRVASAVVRTGAIVSNNVGVDATSFIAPSSGDFRLTKSSPAIDAGTTHWVYAAFQNTFGLPLGRDLYGATRIAGLRIDIGAAEFQP